MDYVSHEVPKRLSVLLEGLEEVAGERTVWALTQTWIRGGNSYRMEFIQSRLKQEYLCGMLFSGSLYETLHFIEFTH